MTGRANGNVAPSRFVRIDTTAADGYFVQSAAGELCYGISQEGTRRAPLNGWDDGYCAIANENFQIYTEFDCDFCWLETGGAVAVGDFLKSDANGKGVTASSENDEVGAVAMQVASGSGLLIKVKPRFKQNI